MKKGHSGKVTQYLVWLTGALSKKPTFLYESGTDVLTAEYIDNIRIGALYSFAELKTELNAKDNIWIVKRGNKILLQYPMTEEQTMKYKKRIANQVTKKLTTR